MAELQTAIVVVRSPDYDPDAPITAANVHTILPDPAAYAAVQAVFSGVGFVVSEGFAGSFSITAERHVFASLLPDLSVDEAGPWLDDVRHHIAAITESDPIDFGPVEP